MENVQCKYSNHSSYIKRRAGNRDNYDCRYAELSDPPGLGTCEQNIYQTYWAECDPNYRFNIKYNQGAVMTDDTQIVPIWLGSWKRSDKKLVEEFIQNVGYSSWYKPIRRYYDWANNYVTGDISLAKSFSISKDRLSNYGLTNPMKNLKDKFENFILNLVKTKKVISSQNAIYALMLGTDVSYEGFCSQSLGMRDFTRQGGAKYIVIGNGNCQSGMFNLEPSLMAMAPNGWQLDNFIATFAHELVEAITSPFHDGWQVFEKGLKQVGDLCADNVHH